MDKFKKIVRVCRYQLSLQSKDMKTKVFFLLLFLYIAGLMSPVREFAGVVGERIAPWGFIILFNDLVIPFVIFSLWCIMVCEAPFQNDGYLYFAGRSGKVNWFFGEILFLTVYSGIFVLTIAVFSIVCGLPYVTFIGNWGKVWTTLAYTDAAEQFSIPFQLPQSLMSDSTPLKALLLSILLVWWVAFLLAVTVFMINWIFRTKIGVAVAWLLVFFDLTIYNILDLQLGSYSVISLSKLSKLTGRPPNFSVHWAILFLSVFTIGTIVLTTVYTMKRKGIE